MAIHAAMVDRMDLEIGRVLGSMKEKPKVTYRLVFFDGEEAFCEDWDECSKPGAPDNTYGSRHYVSKLRQENQLDRVRAMILLDLMGYKNLNLGRDTLSTKWLQDIVWQTAREMVRVTNPGGHIVLFAPKGVPADIVSAAPVLLEKLASVPRSIQVSWAGSELFVALGFHQMNLHRVNIDAIDPDLTLKGLAIVHAEVAGGERLELGLP